VLYLFFMLYKNPNHDGNRGVFLEIRRVGACTFLLE